MIELHIAEITCDNCGVVARTEFREYEEWGLEIDLPRGWCATEHAKITFASDIVNNTNGHHYCPKCSKELFI